MDSIRIIIAEDHNLVRCGIKLLLATDPKISVIAEAVSGAEVLGILKNNMELPDLILTDLNMPDTSGMELLKEIRTNYPAIGVIFLTMLEDNKSISEAFSNGAEGYLTKDISSEELLFAINHIRNGGKYISANLSHKLTIRQLQNVQQPVDELVNLEFNSREIQVLDMIAQGLTNSEMGEKLFLSKRTVEGHRRSLIGKAQCRNSAELIKFAVMHGLIS
ncbi:response regulator transcription factor [Pedobacter hartonius]|uniref:Two component transcriptional regulator, LuxR family n=1 Tax=Pedobacter hartonius TaxID=425514 RepID=A0A1H3W0T3_9SPHI|nr:response regulator transcription factor [Pedobacter hartonius]SDZ80590.1 two component transcriptional regulator, LuxR family [Pedobacter hartonius]